MRWKLAIFDMDGTILDTLEDLQASLNFALERNGLPQRSLEEVRRFVGNGIRKLVERGCPAGTSSELQEAVLKALLEHYQQHGTEHTRPYEGIHALLEALRKCGIRTAVVSNKADFAVQEFSRVYFPGLFDFVTGERAEVRKKPAPDMVDRALEALNIARDEAVYIGDSEVDFQTATNAQMACVLVAWGFRGRAFLETLGPSCSVVDRPEEILTMLWDESVESA